MSYRRFLEDDMSKPNNFGHEKIYVGVSRYLCDVLEDMRKCVETLNFAQMKSLIEEAQILGNRMESALSDQKNMIKLNEAVSEMKRQYSETRATLEREIAELQAQKTKS